MTIINKKHNTITNLTDWQIEFAKDNTINVWIVLGDSCLTFESTLTMKEFIDSCNESGKVEINKDVTFYV